MRLFLQRPQAASVVTLLQWQIARLQRRELEHIELAEISFERRAHHPTAEIVDILLSTKNCSPPVAIDGGDINRTPPTTTTEGSSL